MQPLLVLAQSNRFQGSPVTDLKSEELTHHFTDYGIFAMDLEAVAQFVQATDYRNAIVLDLPGYGTFQMDLFPRKLKTDDFVLTLQHEDHVEQRPYDGVIKTFRGNLSGGKYDVRLTIDRDFMNGIIGQPDDQLMIVPLRFYVDDAPRDQILVFRQSEFIEHTAPHTCGAKHPPVFAPGESTEQEQERSALACLDVQTAFANDWLMFDSYNENVTDVENHNMSVINNVQTNYDNEFADEYVFVVTEIFISMCSTCDPWTNSTSAGALLNSFSTWGGNGFSSPHDIANLWTDRDFDGPTIGIAWVEAVCFPNFKYATCMDAFTNPGLLRALLAHEFGHVFGSDHDPSGSQTIMAPTLGNFNVWSASSVNQINSYMNTTGCLSGCVSGVPPVASFIGDVIEGCVPHVVNFSDESINSPTSWDWTFPGGTPGSSNEQNPTVTYNNPGTFDVILEVSNAAGSDTYVITDYITVDDVPTADFDFFINELEVVFLNLSNNANSYSWDFGDGNFSTDVSPIHNYAEDGLYEVQLTSFNDCGTDMYSVFLDIVTAPFAAFSADPPVGCEPLIVSFVNESSSNADLFFWDFPGGSPSQSTQENPVVIYENPGAYSVTLTVENEAGQDILTLVNYIEVEPDPTASFDATINGSVVEFTNFSVEATDYLWSFGDGGSSTQSDPTYEYAEGGTYEVQLIAFNDCGSDTATLLLTINAAPTAAFATSAQTGCPVFEVTYFNTSSGAESYAWSFPGGLPASSNDENPVVTYMTPGIYPATLIVTNSTGSDTMVMNPAVIVEDPVESDFTYIVNGAAVDFFNLSTGAIGFTWVINAEFFISENVSYTFPEDGDYDIMLIAEGPCGPDTTVQSVHIATLPTAGFTTNSATSGCAPLTVQFQNMSSTNATSFQWTFSGGTPATSTAPNPVVVYNAPGTYDVSLTVWSEVGSDMTTITDLVEVAPQPDAEFQTIQSGLDVEFVNVSGNADTYEWFFGDGTISVEQDPEHTYNTFGTYEVILVATNMCGSDTTSVLLEVAEIPVPQFMAVQASGCAPFEVQFTDMSQNGVETWQWAFPGGMPDSSNAQNPVVVYPAPGIYTVTLIVSNSAGSQALVREDYIVVGEPPVSGFNADVEGETVTLENISIDASSYLWLFGDGETDTVANPVHSYAATGMYLIQLIASNACGSDTSEILVDVVTTAIADPYRDVTINLYPNPNQGAFYIEFGGLAGVANIRVHDIYGRIAYDLQNVQIEGGIQRTIRLDEIPPGVYYAEVRIEQLRRIIRIVVQ